MLVEGRTHRVCAFAGGNGQTLGLGTQALLFTLQVGGRSELTLWAPLAAPVPIAAPFRIVAGCDKRFETCRDRFGNAAAFRGFPHMPGNDYVLRYAAQGEPGQDGSPAR